MISSKSRLFYLLLACFALSLGLLATAAAINEGAIIGDRSNDDDATLLDADNSNAKRGVGGGGSSSSSARSKSSNSPTLVNPNLNEKSVVLITGAAGFIGSELALALRRTYNVKKLLLVDNLGIDSENEAAYVPPSPKDVGGRTSRAVYEKMSEDELSMFEIKRQRAFRIFHELTAAPTGDEDGDESRNNAAESIRFYRADMRPSIPEFFDFGEVPLLEGIFQSHPDITHVVHLADVPLSAQNQAIPRNKDSVKTGRMEGLLEEMRLMLERAATASNGGNNNSDEVQLPQFVYASSHEVYDRMVTANKSTAHQQQQQHQPPNPPPFQEDKPITTPSTLHGTAKLIDEVLASAYHSTHGIYSVGLRFFNVYGPWNAPGTDIFDLAEHVGGGGDLNEDYGDLLDVDVNDYIYIDDAVDGIMSAMQYRPPGSDPPPPVVFNVGTGKGHTLGEVRDGMAKHFPKLVNGQQQRSAKENDNYANRNPTKSIASPTRSELHLGFKAQVSLEEGLAHTLTWHRDRTFPYGRNPTIEESFEQRGLDAKITASLARSRRAASLSGVGDEGGKDGESQVGGEEECSPLDRECLRGAPVFPCASECRRSERCTPSAWDDVAVLSKMVTSGCDAVLYTILLDEDAEQIPSATTAMDSSSFSYVGAGLPEDVGRRTQARCNIAFVSEESLLVKRLMSEGEEYLDEESADSNGSGLPPLLRHGFWTVLPVSNPSTSSWMHAFGGTFALGYLPKVSPGRFFGSSVQYAIYTAPTVLVDNLPSLLKRMESGPPSHDESLSSSSNVSSSTALMLASKRPTCDPAQRGSSCATTYSTPPHQNDMIQSRMYNMIRIALRGDILGGALEPVMDSSFVIHSLREDDSRLFRCDVYGEAAQWGASSDERALEFIVSLHDLWRKAVAHWSGDKPWWTDSGDDGTAVKGVNLDDNEKEEALESGADAKKKEQEAGTWMGILSSSEVQLFTHIIPSEGMGIVHLE